MRSFKEEFDLDDLIEAGVLVEHFPLHSKDRFQVQKSWDDKGHKLIRGFLFGNWEKYMQPLNFIADYYGEKYAFYFAWLIHYTAWLIIPSVLGVLLLALQLYDYFYLKQEFYDAFDTAGNVLYSLVIVLWTTGLVESWKRK